MGMDRHFCGKTWAQHARLGVAVEEDLDRNPLDDLGEVTGGVIGRQQGGRGAAGGSDFGDKSVKMF